MKIQTVSNDELQIQSSGKWVFIFGIALIPIGIAAGVALFLTQENKMTGLIGLAALAVGAALIFFAENKTITLRKSGLSSITTSKLMSSETRKQEFDARGAQFIELQVSRETSNDTNGSKNTSLSSEMYLHIPNTVATLLARESNSLNFSVGVLDFGELLGHAPLQKEAQIVADFLGVPVQINDMSSIMGAVKTMAGLKGTFDSMVAQNATSNNQPTQVAESQPQSQQPVQPQQQVSQSVNTQKPIQQPTSSVPPASFSQQPDGSPQSLQQQPSPQSQQSSFGQQREANSQQQSQPDQPIAPQPPQQSTDAQNQYSGSE